MDLHVPDPFCKFYTLGNSLQLLKNEAFCKKNIYTAVFNKMNAFQKHV